FRTRPSASTTASRRTCSCAGSTGRRSRPTSGKPCPRRRRTPANTAGRPRMSISHPLFDTWDELLREQTPNFLRLYLTPFVAQTCLCLSRYVEETWSAGVPTEHQSFLANSFDEALSGAIKLARFSADVEGRPKTGMVIDPDGRLGPLASVALEGRGRID